MVYPHQSLERRRLLEASQHHLVPIGFNHPRLQQRIARKRETTMRKIPFALILEQLQGYLIATFASTKKWAERLQNGPHYSDFFLKSVEY